MHKFRDVVVPRVLWWLPQSWDLRRHASQLRVALMVGGCCLALAACSLMANGRQGLMGNDVGRVMAGSDAGTVTADLTLASRASIAVAEEDGERPGSPTQLSIGDQVRITIYERLQGFGTGARSVGLIEQTMLSGDYTVEQSGHVVLPLIGAIMVADVSVDNLRREVREAYAKLFRQDASVSVTVTDRQPIYVLGAGAKSGTFKFVPGMTVLHVLALAASDERRDVYLQSELMRQGERHSTSLHKLEKALARTIVLKRERDGRAAEPTPELIRAAGSEKSQTLLDAELRMRKLVVELNQSRIDAARGSIASARREIAEIGQKVTILDEHIKTKKQRKDALSTLTDPRSAKPFLQYQVAAEVYEVEAQRQEVLLALSQAQRRLEESERALSGLLTTQKLDLEKELAIAEQEVAEQEAAVVASERLAQELRMQDAQARLAEQTPTFEIVRQTPHGPERLQAEQMTPLKPGDLVQVRASTRL
jgi:polysaccharide biosynthesis/export protein ExoF